MNQDFESLLVTSITGYKLEEIPEQNRVLLVANCVKLFLDSIFFWVENNYGKKEMIRLKSGLMFNDGKIFVKYPELNPIFSQAYNYFFTNTIKTLAI